MFLLYQLTYHININLSTAHLNESYAPSIFSIEEVQTQV